MEARTAEGGAQGGGVDGDDGLQAGGAVLAQHDLLVAALLRTEQGVQDAVGHFGHGGDSHGRDAAERRPPCGWGRACWEQSKTWGPPVGDLSEDRNTPVVQGGRGVPEVNLTPRKGSTRA